MARKTFECSCGAVINLETDDDSIKCMCCGKLIKEKK